MRLEKILFDFFIILLKENCDYQIDLRKLKLNIVSKDNSVLNKEITEFYIYILSCLENFSELILVNKVEGRITDWVKTKLNFDYKSQKEYKLRKPCEPLIFKGNVGYLEETNLIRKLMNHEILALIFCFKRYKTKGILRKNIMSNIKCFFNLDKSTKTYYVEII